jgi:hypothetical protein
MRGKAWTNDHIEFLKNNWGVLTTEEIAHKLGRTGNAISGKASKMGLPQINSKSKWTDEEIDLLTSLYNETPIHIIAEKLNKSAHSVSQKALRLGLKSNRFWTNEEEIYLQDKWGIISIKGIAKSLGKSIQSVKLKAQRMGLGDARFSYEGITLNQLSKAINISYGILTHWVDLYDFPARKKVFAISNKVLVVQYKDFWKWAEKNRQMLDFTRIEKGILGPEPVWVESKRNADLIKKRKIKKSVNDPWTEEEENILKGMLNAYKYTYPEIAQRLNRSEGAIKRRILDLGLKARPIRLPNHTKYTPQEVELIVSLFDKGHCLEDIASRINKSALGIRGKLERMGYKFRNGVPFKKEQKSDKELLQKWV